MSTIPAEVVEAAAIAYVQRGESLWEDWTPEAKAEALGDMHAALEAAAPHMGPGADDKLAAIIVLLDQFERATSDEAKRRRAFEAVLKIRALLDGPL